MSSAAFQTTEGVDNPLLSNWTDKYGLPPFACSLQQPFQVCAKVALLGLRRASRRRGGARLLLSQQAV